MKQPKMIALFMCALFLVMSYASCLQAADSQLILIDDFSTPLNHGVGDGSKSGILGGTRSVSAGRGNFEIANGQIVFQSDTSAGTPGFDGEPTTISIVDGLLRYGGTEGVSLELNLDISTFEANGGVLIDVAALGTPLNSPANVRISLESEPISFLTVERSLFEQTLTTAGQVFVPFSSGEVSPGASNPVDFTNIDSISVFFTSNVLPTDTQLTINSISLVSSPEVRLIPEPTAFSCLAVLLAGVMSNPRRCVLIGVG